MKEIENLEISKAIQDSDIPVKILKENAEFFAEQICCQFNEAIYSSIFPASFKSANITPVFKVGSRNQKDNYRPISIPPIIAKMFEKLISQQLSSHFDNTFSKFQCGFRKGHVTHHCLLLMTEKWKKPVNNKKVFDTLFTDLSKIFPV